MIDECTYTIADERGQRVKLKERKVQPSKARWVGGSKVMEDSMLVMSWSDVSSEM